MIHYRVRCSQGHEFDGWFKDSHAFDRQAKRGLIECPVCGNVEIARALMAPALPRGREAPPTPAQMPGQAPGPSAGGPPMAISGKGMPDQIRALLQKMRAEIEKTCEYVGPGFADEARRIHRGESERRGIYGEATPEQAESLSDEGIPIARIPWVDRADG
ncbi:MAG TPA: DUF1178 family protein [Acetobacteraceae bacterium]|jgi:hypothetical protein|nr:DUF1178 family protein [Acetobacteraceae bacterium]